MSSTYEHVLDSLRYYSFQATVNLQIVSIDLLSSVHHLNDRLTESIKMPSQAVQPADADERQAGLSVRTGHCDLTCLSCRRC